MRLTEYNGAGGVLMLVDGNSIVNRAYYAFNGQSGLITRDGFPTHAIFGFLSIFNKYLDEVKPTHVCIAFDVHAPTFRHKEYELYKAGRKGMPDDLAAQMPVLKDVIDALGLRRAECAGYEADDILGALSLKAEQAGMECVIITGDRDSLQLVSSAVRVMLPVTRGGQTRTEIYDEAAVMEKYGVTPELFIDLKGLMGDSSDNIPGVPGVGEKTASELVGRLGGIDSIYADLDAVERKTVRAKLEAGKELAYLSRRLATIARDVPCELQIGDLLPAAPDRGNLYNLFTKLQFQSYILKMGLTRADTALADAAPGDAAPGGAAPGGAVPAGTVVAGAAATGAVPAENTHAFTDKISGARVVVINGKSAFDVMIAEITASVHSGEGGGLVFYPIFEKPGGFRQALFGAACMCGEKAYYFESCREQNGGGSVRPARGIYEVPAGDVLDGFRTVFSNPGTCVAGHDVKQICHWLLANGESCPAFDFDTMLGAYVADAALGAYSLPELYLSHFGDTVATVEDILGRGKSRKSLYDFTPVELAQTSAACAAAIYKLTPRLKSVISENGQEDLLYNIEIPLSETLASMEVAGFRVDVDGLRVFSSELDSYISQLTDQIHRYAGEEFNINSTKQLGVILYEKLGLKPVKKTKTGYSTDADALLDLTGKHPIVDKISEYRQHVKLRSTYTDALIDLIDPADGRIHTTLNQAVTATGRISSAEPNLQNIPVRLALGREIRRLFIPEGEGIYLLGADYSQIELRILAHLSEDAGLAEAFREGADIHRSTASKVFGVPESEVTEEMRTRAKAVNFGIVYGIGEFSLARDIGVTRGEAREYIDGYLDKYEGVKRYMKDSVEQGRQTGWTYTLLHRRRSLAELKSSNYNTRAFGERVAMNTPVQGSAADIMKIAMVRAYGEFKKRGLKSRLILQVHDELIAEALEGELVIAAGILRESMEHAAALSVPLVADVYYGSNWKDIKKEKAPLG